MKRYKHRDFDFPSGYVAVEVNGDSVLGIMPTGERIASGWEVDEAEYFVAKGLWVEA